MIGLALALAYTGAGRLVRAVVAAYVEFVRNVPLLLLVYLVFYGIPSAGGFAYEATTSFVITLSALRRRLSGRGLPGRARRGAARAWSMRARRSASRRWQRLLHVRLPTMFRIVLPSLSNAFISLFKDTSLASVIAVPELTYGAQWIKTNTFRDRSRSRLS